MSCAYRAKTENYIHRKVAGTDVLVSIGGNIANFNGYIELNPAAAFLWDEMKKGISEEGLIRSLAAEFDIDPGTAAADTREFLERLIAHDMAEMIG